MDFLLGFGAGAALLLGYLLVNRVRTSANQQEASINAAELAVLNAMLDAWVILDEHQNVLTSSDEAQELDLATGNKLTHANVTNFVAEAIKNTQSPEGILEIPRSALGTASLALLANLSPISNNRYLLILRDVSDVTRVELVRRDFVANVSHELKTPVGALSLLSEAAAEAADDPAAVRRFALKMQAEAQRLTNLVNDLIDLSRLQSDDPLKKATIAPVARLVDAAVSDVKAVADAKEIELSVKIQTGLQVACVERQLITAIRNLIVNAVNYSSNQTKVAITAEEVDDLIEIRVTDQGVGIPETDQLRVFERFYRIDPARSRATGGTGLGLSIVKHIATGHGGDVILRSIEGKGSTFTLRLPTPSEETLQNLSKEVVA
ncbi:MAG: ATP-binding protein [Actinobacteria bacterium]|nr:ATP-binding protein [Actinomycetota bacterium]